jgi:hypothetical protein
MIDCRLEESGEDEGGNSDGCAPLAPAIAHEKGDAHA